MRTFEITEEARQRIIADLNMVAEDIEYLQKRNWMLEDMLEVLGVPEERWFTGYSVMVKKLEEVQCEKNM